MGGGKAGDDENGLKTMQDPASSDLGGALRLP